MPQWETCFLAAAQAPLDEHDFIGRLLAERGRPVPVVLDDSLVFSDDDRIERMFDVLTRAAEKQQVIVLTCRSRAFLSCGGRTLSIVRQDG